MTAVPPKDDSWMAGAEITMPSSSMPRAPVGQVGPRLKHSAATASKAFDPSALKVSFVVHSTLLNSASAPEMALPRNAAGPSW